jgi:hypothetical protein
MDSASDQFLSGTGFTVDQHRRIDSRDVANLLIDLLHRGAFAQEIVKLRPLIE